MSQATGLLRHRWDKMEVICSWCLGWNGYPGDTSPSREGCSRKEQRLRAVAAKRQVSAAPPAVGLEHQQVGAG